MTTRAVAVARHVAALALKTDLAGAKASKKLIHERYKDLAPVEWGLP